MSQPNDIVAGNTTLKEIQERTGIMEGAAEDHQAESQEEAQESNEQGEESTEESTEEAAETEEDETSEEDEEDEDSKTQTPGTTDKAIKALFSQMNAMRDQIDLLVKSGATKAEQAQAAVVDEELSKLAEELNASPDQINKLLQVFEKRIQKQIGTQSLTPELQEVLDSVREQKRVADEVAHFNKEWDSILPDLRKQYPNASESQLALAKEEMDKLSHSKEFHKYPLDYIVYRQSKKFDTLLKVVKGRSGEATVRGSEGVNETGEIDLDPENMTPEKMKQHQARRVR